MINNIKKYFQAYLFKVRVIYTLDCGEEMPHPNYEIIKISKEVVKEYSAFFQKYIDNDKLRDRISNSDCTGFLAIHRSINQPVGFEWAIVSKNKEYRHDNFLIPKNNGLLFNAYVCEAHRGNGVFRSLKIKAANYLLDNEDCKHALSVVELLNTSSIVANEKIGSVKVGKNYLVKFLGRNLFSITKMQNRNVNIDYVLTGPKKVRI